MVKEDGSPFKPKGIAKPPTAKELEALWWEGKYFNTDWKGLPPENAHGLDYDLDGNGNLIGLTETIDIDQQITNIFKKVSPLAMEEPKEPNCKCSEHMSQYNEQLMKYNDMVSENKAEKKPILHLIPTTLPMKVDAQPQWGQKSVKGSSHDKAGKYGGVSSYTDADVVEARAYMKDVLKVGSMQVNGRDLAHILAEVSGFAERSLGTELTKVKRELGLMEFKYRTLEATHAIASNTLQHRQETIEKLQKKLEVQERSEKHKVETVETGRRIKEDYD